MTMGQGLNAGHEARRDSDARRDNMAGDDPPLGRATGLEPVTSKTTTWRSTN